MPNQNLFGGAVSLNLPSGYFDVSTIRQIPDNQEVWLENDSDASIIVELVQIPSAEDDKTAFGTYYFEELAQDNAAKGKKIFQRRDLSVPSKLSSDDASATAEFIEGQQEISKFNTDNFDSVHIWLATFRLPRVGSDLLITWNDPYGKVSESVALELFSSLCIADWSLFSPE